MCYSQSVQYFCRLRQAPRRPVLFSRYERNELMSRKIKRIVALLGVIILVALYLATLILAFVDPTEAKNWLKAAVVCTVIIPIFFYAYLLIYRNLKK